VEDGELVVGIIMDAHLGRHEMGARRVLRDLQPFPVPGDRIVAVGLYSSWNGPRLISAATRLQGLLFWDFVIYLVEGMFFLVTGLQARTLIAWITDDNIQGLVTAAAIVSAMTRSRSC
jgi:hypothetical protein